MLLLSQLASVRKLSDGRALEISFVDIKKAYFNAIPKRERFLFLPREMGLGSKPIKVSMANQKNRVEGGGGLSPPPGGISSWGGVSAWPAQPSTATSGWPGPGGNPGAPQPAGHGGASWPGMGGVSSPGSGGSGPPAAATSPGPDYSAYHQYYQQYAA